MRAVRRWEELPVRAPRKARKASAPVTDYTLARRAALAQYRRGTLNIFEICDAHPELMRAGRNIGRPMDTECPVCSGEGLRMVRYVYGDELKHLSGRVVYPEDWIRDLSTNYDEFRCYAVEVCILCGWNYLLAVYLMGRRYQRRRRSRGSAVSAPR